MDVRGNNYELPPEGGTTNSFSGGIMPKLKTHKGAAKRFRLTATGKVKRGHSHARHILTSKTTKRKRQLDIDSLVSDADEKPTKRMLPYGRG
jgi:large subunit ribosomal protein L35